MCEKFSNLEEYIKEVWKDYKDSFEEDAAEEIGEVVKEYERHPDTGEILADNSYIKNEEEVLEKAKEDFVDAVIYNFDNYIDEDIVRDLLIKTINKDKKEITIPYERYIELLNEELKLDVMMRNGLEDWKGYNTAIEWYEEEKYKKK